MYSWPDPSFAGGSHFCGSGAGNETKEKMAGLVPAYSSTIADVASKKRYSEKLELVGLGTRLEVAQTPSSHFSYVIKMEAGSALPASIFMT